MATCDDNTRQCVELFSGKKHALSKHFDKAIFSVKELDKYLESEADVTKGAKIRDTKKVYVPTTKPTR